MRKANRFALLITMVVLAAMLSVAGVVSAQDPVTIRWWHINTIESQMNYWQSVADAFVAVHRPNEQRRRQLQCASGARRRITTEGQPGLPCILRHDATQGGADEFCRARIRGGHG